MNKRSNTLVIIPAYNEEQSITFTLQDLHSACPDVDIVVVNDGSIDNTAEVAKSTGLCNVITLPHNLGIGGAVQTGLKYAFRNGYDYACQFDADGQHVAEEIELLFASIKNGDYDVCIGSRFIDNSSFRSTPMRRLGINILKTAIRIATNQKISDPTSGFRGYNKRGIRFLSEYYPQDFPEVEALVVLKKNKFRINEIPVKMRERQGGESSIKAFKAVYYMIKVLLAIFVCSLRHPRKEYIPPMENEV
ncbi:MAG: glycosyltransferase family 2 protein [Armatimonadota bacterium]